MAQSRKSTSETGAIVVTILALMIFFSTMILGLVAVAQANLTRARGRIMLLQAQYAAESGADAAIAELNASAVDPPTYTGTGSDVTLLNTGQYRATYNTTVTDNGDNKERVITAVGKVYDPASSSTPSYTRTIRVTANRTSTTTASSIMSRNIIDVASGVKNIIGKEIYVNGYINMPKNTTNLIAEKITVAGSNPSSADCSLGPNGSSHGNLVPPTSYSDPSQTTTLVNLSHKNCLVPIADPSKFTVTENISNISTIKSIYIPWSQYMDGTYQSSPGGCSDWTTGTSPRTIPSTGNTKKTHYPNSGSGVLNTCGTSGNLALGSATYNITDNVHIRANLCATAGCQPTFNNPESTTKYIFVEGTINFSAVFTSAGSGPIVFISYAADPASKTSVCPLGGSIYLGDSNNTIAPAAYFLATNGICLDKTKFGADPALGGVGGKNIYVSTSPGTPFDLTLDPNFPVDDIPIDLAWRAVYYERL